MIKIQKENFNLEEEIQALKHTLNEIGAVSTFIGYVRNNNNDKKVTSIYLDVYPSMAQKSLEEIVNKAKKKWDLLEVLIIHRYGELKIGEKIVLVATFSQHRHDSIEACNFIMDFLKKEAPFWKTENYDNGYSWLENTNLMI